MNTNLGLIGRKLGCTQIFNDNGTVVRVTVVQCGPCQIVRKRTQDKDGYDALQLSFGLRSAKNVNKPKTGYFAKNGVAAVKATVKGNERDMLPETLKEIRLTTAGAAKFEVGQVLGVTDVFTQGQFVDAVGTSTGRGFSGVMRRHNFKGCQTSSHGTHEYKRHGGSIGTNMTPGRTMPGKKMPGQHGNKRHSEINLTIARLIPEQNLVLIEGSVPGARNSIVVIRGAVKNGKHA